MYYAYFDLKVILFNYNFKIAVYTFNIIKKKKHEHYRLQVLISSSIGTVLQSVPITSIIQYFSKTHVHNLTTFCFTNNNPLII